MRLGVSIKKKKFFMSTVIILSSIDGIFLPNFLFTVASKVNNAYSISDAHEEISSEILWKSFLTRPLIHCSSFITFTNYFFSFLYLSRSYTFPKKRA